MVSSFDGAPRGPETLLGVVQSLPTHELPAAGRETLARTAAEILRDSGATFGAGEIIILAAWLGGMN